jgi:hypothetical protein
MQAIAPVAEPASPRQVHPAGSSVPSPVSSLFCFDRNNVQVHGHGHESTQPFSLHSDLSTRQAATRAWFHPGRTDHRHPDSRIAKVQHLVGALKAAAALVKASCMVIPGCASSGDTAFVMDGRAVRVNWGYPEAGDSIGNNQIDTTLDTTGFVGSLPDNLTTKFSVDDAPDPANCAVTYQQALQANPRPTITATISGC